MEAMFAHHAWCSPWLAGFPMGRPITILNGSKPELRAQALRDGAVPQGVAIQPSRVLDPELSLRLADGVGAADLEPLPRNHPGVAGQAGARGLAGLGRPYIGESKIVALEQQRRIQGLGQSVAESVAEVAHHHDLRFQQRCRIPSHLEDRHQRGGIHHHHAGSS